MPARSNASTSKDTPRDDDDDLGAFYFSAGEPPTLLLWSLTLMMRSFLRRSHTEARPLGLAEARMCWTCRFHDRQPMSSTGCSQINSEH